MEWLWNDVIWTSIEKELNFQKKKKIGKSFSLSRARGFVWFNLETGDGIDIRTAPHGSVHSRTWIDNK